MGNQSRMSGFTLNFLTATEYAKKLQHVSRIRLALWTVLVILCSFVIFIISYNRIPEVVVRRQNRFAVSIDPKDILPSLRWYADNALGALKPVDHYIFVLPSGPAQKSAEETARKQAIEKLEREQVLNITTVVRETDFQWYVKILQPYRSHVWWPGKPYEEQIFFYSPVEYEVVSVDEVQASVMEGVSVINVTFSWKVKNISKFFELIDSLNMLPFEGIELPLPVQHWAAIRGRVSQHAVLMQKNDDYGYFLPITREPVDSQSVSSASSVSSVSVQ